MQRCSILKRRIRNSHAARKVDYKLSSVSRCSASHRTSPYCVWFAIKCCQRISQIQTKATAQEAGFQNQTSWCHILRDVIIRSIIFSQLVKEYEYHSCQYAPILRIRCRKTHRSYLWAFVQAITSTPNTRSTWQSIEYANVSIPQSRSGDILHTKCRISRKKDESRQFKQNAV